MPQPIPASPWANALTLDLDDIVKNWALANDGATYQRCMNRATALESVALHLNALLGQMPRTIFMRGHRSTHIGSTASLDPLYRWRYRDRVANGYTRRYKIITFARQAGTGNARCERYGSSSETTQNWNVAASTLTFPNAAMYADFTYERGARAAEGSQPITDGISTFNGYQVADICVQDEPLNVLDPATHLYAPTPGPQPGQRILAALLEQLRAALHDVRTTNLPIAVMWAACGQTGTPTPSDQTGIHITSTSFVNVLDTSYVSRTASSPGAYMHARYAGLGQDLNDNTNGQRVAMRCHVLANAPASNGSVKFIGPTHVASNDITITVTGGGGLGWYGATSDVIYLNTTSAPDVDTGTTRNKIDIHAKVATGGDHLYIYGLIGELYLMA